MRSHPTPHDDGTDDSLGLLAAAALDALDPEDRSEAARLQRGPFAGAAREFRATAIALGATATCVAPTDLGGHVMKRALSRRASGRPSSPWAIDALAPPGAPSPATALGRNATAIEVYRRTLLACERVVTSLSGYDWSEPIPPYAALRWQARDLLAHLHAGEELFLASIGQSDFRAEPGTEADHLASTAATVAAYAGRPVIDVIDAWERSAGRTRSVLGMLDDLDRTSDLPDELAQPSLLSMRLPLNVVLTLRSFEVWTHTEDLQRAAGLVPSGLEPIQLQLLCRTAVRVVPLAMAALGLTQPHRTARVVLLGPGGGAWSIATAGEPSDHSSVLIVAEGLDFCRLAANRLEPEQLACRIEGDGAFARDVLRAASAFAV